MSEKPQKRLVIHSNAGRDKTRTPRPQLATQRKYVFLLGKSVSLTFLSITSAVVAILLLLMTVVRLLGIFYIWPIVTALVTGGLSWVFFLAAGKLSKKANEIDHCKPITARNAYLLPHSKTLVRASDLPPSHPQTELLRAAPQGRETPAEELLRASTNRQGSDNDNGMIGRTNG